MSEDQDLLLKIGQLSGQINLHKSQQETNAYPPSWRPRRGTPYGGSSRGRAGRARQAPPSHRHRTLVLNANGGSGGEADPQPTAETGQPAWITKHARHNQLINPAVYAKEVQGRARELEATRQARAKRKDERERTKIQHYMHKLAGQDHTHMARQQPQHELIVKGVKFQVQKGGSKLLRRDASSLPTPKHVSIGGVRFHRSKSGNLYRSGLVRTQRSTVTKKDELCEQFTRTGQCAKGPSCRYTHDPERVSICKEYLQTGKCASGAACDLSHEATAARVPACLHFLRGKCANPAEECRYAHVRVNPAAPVCRAFARLGYCAAAESCRERHVYECPDYANKGSCGNPKCRLPHIDRAGKIRQAANEKEKDNDDDNEGMSVDLSSDESVDEDDDDVDSDGLDLVDVPDEPDVRGISNQDDFVHF